MTPAEFLHSHRVFTREEFVAAMDVPAVRSAATLSRHLSLWGAAGRVRRVRKGLYVRVDGAHDATEPSLDPYGLAARLAPDAVLGFHTALELHGLAQSEFHRLYVCTWSRVRALRFAGMEYVPVRPRAGLADAPLEGVVDRDRPDGPVRVTALERTVLDVLDRPDLGGGVEEVWRSLNAVGVLDFRLLESLLARVTRPVLVARLGFLLESKRDRWLVPAGLLDRLARSRPKGPVYLDRAQRGHLVSRWNLVVPPNLLHAANERVADDAI